MFTDTLAKIGTLLFIGGLQGFLTFNPMMGFLYDKRIRRKGEKVGWFGITVFLTPLVPSIGLLYLLVYRSEISKMITETISMSLTAPFIAMLFFMFLYGALGYYAAPKTKYWSRPHIGYLWYDLFWSERDTGWKIRLSTFILCGFGLLMLGISAISIYI